MRKVVDTALTKFAGNTPFTKQGTLIDIDEIEPAGKTKITGDNKNHLFM